MPFTPQQSRYPQAPQRGPLKHAAKGKGKAKNKRDALIAQFVAKHRK
jgi:hypothetical protein